MHTIATFFVGIAAAINGFLGGLFQPNYGTTITSIAGSDTISSSRTVINDNFTALNNGKIEQSNYFATTSLPTSILASSLTSLGTIGTGIWRGTAIEVGYGGTGTTSPTSNMVMLGNGASGLKVVSGFGNAGQFLTSNGASAAPTWQSSTVNVNDDYDWTGTHTFAGQSDFNATTTIDASNYLSNALVLNGVPYQFPSLGIASSTTWAFDANGKATYQYINKTQGIFSTSTPIGSQTIAHGLGHTPSWVKMTAKYASGGTTSFQAAESIGIWDRGVYSTIYHYSSVITNGGGSDNSITTGILYLFTDSDNDKSTATITVDATNIYLTWATDGAPINTASVLWEAE